MDVCVSPHSTFYASPMKVLEYMAMGKAVIAPAMDNIRDLIGDGRNGRLFEPGMTKTLTAAMRDLVEDVQLRRTLGERHGVQLLTSSIGAAMHCRSSRPPET